MTKHSHTWFHRFARNGDLHDVAEKHREEILELWAKGLCKREISTMLDLHRNTVQKIVRQARLNGDKRGFAKTTPLLSASCDSVLELRREQWFIRGLASRLEIHFTQAESLIRDVIDEVKHKEAEK